jgi:hypothetical protein
MYIYNEHEERGHEEREDALLLGKFNLKYLLLNIYLMLVD